MEAVVRGFEQDRGVGGGELWEAEQGQGLGGVRHRGLFEQHVFAGAEGFDGPFKVQPVGKRDEDGVDVRVGKDLWYG